MSNKCSRNVVLTTFIFTAAIYAGVTGASVSDAYDISRVGLIGGEFQQPVHGYESSNILLLNANGIAVGTSMRFNAGLANNGQAIWLDDGTGAIRLGFFGQGYQRSDTGFEYSEFRASNDHGQVLGVSFRYDGTNRIGEAVWIDTGSGPMRLGFTGGRYRAANGAEFSVSRAINNRGQAIGYSTTYDTSSYIAWIDDGTGPIRLGLTGPEYQSTEGEERSEATRINNKGHVTGGSRRYNGSDFTGWAAWIDDGSAPRRLGYFGPGYRHAGNGEENSAVVFLDDVGRTVGFSTRYHPTNVGATTEIGQALWIDYGGGPARLGFYGSGYSRESDDRQYSEAKFFNETGQVAGHSARYYGSDSAGQAAWIDNGSGPMRLGFTGSGYQSSINQFENSGVVALNDRGQALGWSERFNGADSIGGVSWIDDGTGPTRLGFEGLGYQRMSDGAQFGAARFLNNQGQAVGYTMRYDGDTATGRAAWFDEGAGPVRLGMIGEGYERSSDGYQFSEVLFLNDQGQAVGYSERFDGTKENGRSGWFYDADTDAVTELIFSTKDDGFAYTDIIALLDDGTVVGSYVRYDGLTSLGASFFIWDAEGGFADVDSLATSPDVFKLVNFDAGRPTDSGFLAAVGRTEGDVSQRIPGSQLAFILTPIPEPSSLTLLLIGACSLCIRRRNP